MSGSSSAEPTAGREPTRGPVSRPGFRSVAVGLTISGGCVYGLSSTIDLAQVASAVADADVVPLAVSVALTAVTVSCRVWRWQALLLPETRLRFFPAVEATLIGYLLIAVLPGRVGELARGALVGRTGNIGTARAIGTIAVEKLFDIAALFVMLGGLALLVPIPLWARNAGLSVGAAFTVFLVGFVVAVGMRSKLVGWVERRIDPMPLFRNRGLAPALDGLLGAGSSLRHPRLLGVQLTSSAVLWALAIGQVYLATIAFHLTTGWDAATFLLVSTNLGMTVPSAPASLGVYHGITVLALDAFGVDRPTALGLAIGMHALGFGTLSLAGGVCLAGGVIARRFTIADLWRWHP